MGDIVEQLECRMNDAKHACLCGADYVYETQHDSESGFGGSDLQLDHAAKAEIERLRAMLSDCYPAIDGETLMKTVGCERVLEILCCITEYQSSGSTQCPDGLLPDGDVCPRCGGNRAPSGVNGGSWVHTAEGVTL